MVMVNGDGGGRAGLLVGPDPILGHVVSHEEVAGHCQLVEGLAGHTKHETQQNYLLTRKLFLGHEVQDSMCKIHQDTH